MFNIDLPSWTVNAIADSLVEEERATRVKIHSGQTKTRNNPTLNKGNYVVFINFQVVLLSLFRRSAKQRRKSNHDVTPLRKK